jgi:hypothetical protein
MTTNKNIFYTKWRAQLDAQHGLPSEPFDLAATQRYKHRILWVSLTHPVCSHKPFLCVGNLIL